ncbi:hypothetical protein [Flavobacterium sp. AJR]|uniref:hypothetical protein n=1 Tax=Flavobacterium sp. AJR TaxID=1979369 RepID=UPI000A3D753A|nr:hypothetical protein [Flavobacterium sp. AJR]OUL60727.1 hypothetical protein B8T70_18805 [Flavobacterium sp. AJR]
MKQEEKPTRTLYVTNEHPYYEDVKSVKISGNPEFTSPIINVFEEKNAKHDIETGKNLGKSLHGMYYDTKNGKFVKKWINGKLLTSVSSVVDNDFLELIVFAPETKLKDAEEKFINKYLSKKVTLHSVDVELNKIKINRSNSNGSLVETNHLDFLPPIMHVIGYRFTDEKKKYCDETGKLNIEFKCKWYNHVTKSYSEDFFPYQILLLIKPIKDLQLTISGINDTINSNKLIQYPINKKFTLEGKEDIAIDYQIIEPREIIFKHYFHNLNSFDFLSQKDINVNQIKNLIQIDDNVIWGESYPSYINNKKQDVSDCSFNEGQYLYVKYKDQFERITNRIIRISQLLIYGNDSNLHENVGIKLNEGFAEINKENWSQYPVKQKLIENGNISIIIKANCLLRNGKIRYFRLDGILNIKVIKNFVVIRKTKDGEEITTNHSLFENIYKI